MTVLITFSSIGSDAGPFNLYSNVDGYAGAFAAGVSKAQLLAGFPSSSVPNGTTIIRAKSFGLCTNFVDLNVIPAGSTTTTTTPAPSTTTSTTLAPITTTTTTTAATIPSLVILGRTDDFCFSVGGVRVVTSIPVKVNMIATFAPGGSYRLDVGLQTANIVNQVISAMTIYQFGIEGAEGGTLSPSDILFTVNDFTTGDIIASYTFTRLHNISPC